MSTVQNPLLRVVAIIIRRRARRLPTAICLLVHAPLTRRPVAAAGKDADRSGWWMQSQHSALWRLILVELVIIPLPKPCLCCWGHRVAANVGLKLFFWPRAYPEVFARIARCLWRLLFVGSSLNLQVKTLSPKPFSDGQGALKIIWNPSSRCCHVANDLSNYFTGDRRTNKQTNRQTEEHRHCVKPPHLRKATGLTPSEGLKEKCKR